MVLAMNDPFSFSPPSDGQRAARPSDSNEPASTDTVHSSASRSFRRGRAGWIVAACLAIVAGVFGSLWSDARSDLDAVRSERDVLQAAADAAQAEAEALPDVFAVVDKHVGDVNGFDVIGDEKYASVSVIGRGLAQMDELTAALVELGFSPSIEARMGNTRALDGTLTASGDKVTASWTYHPDDGLSIVLEREE